MRIEISLHIVKTANDTERFMDAYGGITVKRYLSSYLVIIDDGKSWEYKHGKK